MTDPTQALRLADVLDSWRLRLLANRRSPKTITSYLEAAHHLEAWLAASGRSDRLADIERRTKDAYQAHQFATPTRRGGLTKPSTVASRHRCLKQLFLFLVGDGVLDASPMAAMPVPTFAE